MIYTVKMKQEATSGFIGFTGPLDFIHSLLGAKTWLFNTTFAICGALTTFITNYIWDDPKAVWTLWSLMLADWITGIAKGVVTKRFVSFKIWRMPIYFVVTSYVLHIAWGMAKGNIVYTLLPGIVICGFYSVYFISLLENLAAINALPHSLVKLLKSKFGLKKLFDQDKKEQSN